MPEKIRKDSRENNKEDANNKENRNNKEYRDTKAKEEDLRKKYMQLQMLNQQLKQLQKQIQAFDSQISDLEGVKNSLEELEKTPAGTEILVPVSGGIFAKAELKDSKSLLVNVGANIGVKKTSEQTKKMLSDQVNEISDYKNKMRIKLDELIGRMHATEKEMEALAQ